MKKTISIIDDNNSLLTSLALQFQSHEYETITFLCPQKALEYHSLHPADGYIIDMKMPKLTGVEFYKQLCQKLNKEKLPALFLTAVHELEVKVLKQTSIGDFVKKPFSFDILIARLEKVISHFTTQEKSKNYKLGNLEIIPEQIMVKWFGKDIEMTKSEFAVVEQLVKRPYVVNTRNHLLDICYGEDIAMVDRNIDSHIKRIRKKFRESNPSIDFDRIKTHYGTGYSWQCKSLGATA